MASVDDTGVTLDRRFLAVLCADVAGYSRLMDAAEEETHRRFMRLRSTVIDPVVSVHQGRIVKHTGDGFLASFENAGDAVECAIEMQDRVARAESGRSPEDRIMLRIGVTVGDVIVESSDIFGGGVNTAARLQQVAAPGGIVVSSKVLEHVRGRIDLVLEDLGRLRLKNLHGPTQAFSIRPAGTVRSPAAPRPSRKRTRLPSIAVLPFRTLGDEPDRYFAQGMVEDIIGALSSLRDLMVIGRGSTFGFADSDLPPAAVGKRLGVRYVLTGSVRRTSDQVRISTALTDVRSGSVLSADRMDGALASLFDLQDRIATRTVAVIAPHVREAELARAVRKRPENMDAYDLVLQGIDLLYRMDLDQFLRARRFLEQAVEADDRYAAAYAYASLWHIFCIGQGWSHDAAADAEQAWRLAAAGVARDASDPLALALCGHIKSFLFHEYEAATAYFDRALSCCPNHAWAWTLSSGTYAYMGQAKSAIARAEHGLKLSPADRHAFYYLSFLGLAHYANQTYEEAVEWDRKALGQNANFRAGLRVLAASLVALGRMEEARDVALALMREQPSFRVSAYAPYCPWRDAEVRSMFLERLVKAGLPE
jgi:adenylate cyclase